MRPAASAILVLACLLASTLAVPTADAFHLRLSEIIRWRAPSSPAQGVTATGGVLPANFTTATTLAQNVSLDADDTLRAIALDRRLDAGLDVNSISDRTRASSAQAINDQLPELGAVLDALLIGTFDTPLIGLALTAIQPYLPFKIPKGPAPLALFILSDRTFEETLSYEQRARVPADTTEAALILGSAGIRVDPDRLVELESNDTTRAFYEGAEILSVPLAAAFATFGIVPGGVVPLDGLSNLTALAMRSTETSRRTSVDADLALAAVAAHRQGIRVDSMDDVARLEDRTRTTTRTGEDLTIPRGDVLSALLLGIDVGPVRRNVPLPILIPVED